MPFHRQGERPAEGGGGGGGSGDVVGPASATDNAIARFDGTTGKLIQSGGSTVNDSGDIVSARHVRVQPMWGQIRFDTAATAYIFGNGEEGSVACHAGGSSMWYASGANGYLQLYNVSVLGYLGLDVDRDSRLESPADDVVTLDVGGVELLRCVPTELRLSQGIWLRLDTDLDSGIRCSADDQLDLMTGGQVRLRVRDGDVAPIVANVDLGRQSFPWRDLYLSGDITAAGGFRRDAYLHYDVSAGSSADVARRAGGTDDVDGAIICSTAGSITSLHVVAAGLIVLRTYGAWVQKSTDNGATWSDSWGSSASPVVTLDPVTNTRAHRATQPKDTTTFAAGDLLRVVVDSTSQEGPPDDPTVIALKLTIEC